MSFTPKRPCPDPMNDSMEKRIKRISIEGNIGECCSLLQKSHLTKQKVQFKGLMSADGCQVLLGVPVCNSIQLQTMYS